METLQLDEGVFLQADDGVARVGRIEHIVVDGFGGAADTVHTANALHQARGVPRTVVVDDDIGTMQVDAFGQHIAGDDDVIVVALLFLVVGVEVGADVFFLAVAVAGANRKDVVSMQPFLKLFGQIVDRVDAFAEDHQLAAWVASGIKQFALQHLNEKVKFRVGIDGIPSLAKTFEQVGVIFQHGQEIGQEVGGLKYNLVLVKALAQCQFYDFVQLHSIGLQLLNVQVGSDNHFVLAEHLDHAFCSIEQGV